MVEAMTSTVNRILLAVAIGFVALIAFPASVAMASGPCTKPNCYPTSGSDPTYCSYTDSNGLNYVVSADVWNDEDITQTMQACGQDSWTVDATASSTGEGGAVQSYPDVYSNIDDVPESDYADFTSNFAFTNSYPSGGFATNADFENAYDIWMGTSDTWNPDGHTEMMIWVKKKNQVPAGSEVADQSIDGATYKTYVAGTANSAEGDIVTYVLEGGTSSGEVDFTQFFSDALVNGWLTSNSLADVYLWQIGFGAEICYTPAAVTFNNVTLPGLQIAVTNFTLSPVMETKRH